MYKVLLSIISSIFCVALAQDPCTVTSYDEVIQAVANCMNIQIVGITVPQAQTLTLNLRPNTTVTFSGIITFAHYNWDGPLVHISGNGVYLRGTPDSRFDGLGPSYWDGLGDNGVKKPTFFKIDTSGMSTLINFNIINCPKQCVAVAAHHTVLSQFLITNDSEDPKLPRNTDGFDLAGASYVRIEHSIVRNQDDCVAVNQGNELTFKNLTCYGGHGLSLSVGFSPIKGLSNIVHNVHFHDCSVINSRNGIHIKTHVDAGIGFITNVTYKNIQLFDIDYYGINVQQDYIKGNSTGTPADNIPITHLLFQNIFGTMTGLPESMPVYILTTGCLDWNWLNVSIRNGVRPDSCSCTPHGFTCS